MNEASISLSLLYLAIASAGDCGTGQEHGEVKALTYIVEVMKSSKVGAPTGSMEHDGTSWKDLKCMALQVALKNRTADTFNV